MNKKIKNYQLTQKKIRSYIPLENDFCLKSMNQNEQKEEKRESNSSYLRDSIRRFKKNKSSVVAFFILVIIALYAIIVPLCSPFSYISNPSYSKDEIRLKDCLPKISLFEGSGFMDGTQIKTINDSQYYLYKYYDTSKNPLVNDYGIVEDTSDIKSVQSLHKVRIDSYAFGSTMINISKEEYSQVKEYEKENDVVIIQPLIDYESYLNSYRNELIASSYHYNSIYVDQIIDSLKTEYSKNANVSYKLRCLQDSDGYIINCNVFVPYFNENNEIQSLYKDKVINENGEYVDADISNSQYKVRVDFSNYYTYKYGFSPVFVFGSNSAGQDLFLRLAKGCLFSLLLGIIVTLFNFTIGLIYGAIEGFHGGKVDLYMERFADILAAIPGTIILVLFNIYFNNIPSINSTLALVLGLFVAFILTGWIGPASTTRMQFYRFKNQEYVLASKTLGASNKRLIFHHILPNAIGTLITASILMIPSVIFSESSLSYLGIIDFSSSALCSIGQLLNEGRSTLGSNNSYLLLFPSIIVSLLMISFNLLGNGLRDGFNSSLREGEDN